MTAFHHSYHYHSSVVGWLELGVSAAGLRSIAFVSAPARPQDCIESPVMKRLVEQLDCYFNGEAVVFTAPLDLSGTTPFQRRVWDELTSIPYGKTRSYSEVAAAVGNRAAARAVGAANRSNPIPIVIPCHRVIKADGTLGGYSSGIAIKEQLLRLEAAR